MTQVTKADANKPVQQAQTGTAVAQPEGKGEPGGANSPAGQAKKSGNNIQLSGTPGQSQLQLPSLTTTTTTKKVTRTVTVTEEETTSIITMTGRGVDAPEQAPAAAAPSENIPDFGATFGTQSYVKDGGNKDLLSLAQKVVDANPADKDGVLAKELEAGKLSPAGVKALQQELQAKGYSVGDTGVDGKFGPRTHRALQQMLAGAKPDVPPGQIQPPGHDASGNDDAPINGPAKPTPTPNEPNSDQEYDVGGPQPAVKRQGKLIGKSIAQTFDAMVVAARKDGVDLTINSGMRTRTEQEALYRKYKGKRPVAVPGTSLHEKGNAIDFGNNPGAHAWLKRNAAKFGLHNLPSEPWHYSTTGH